MDGNERPDSEEGMDRTQPVPPAPAEDGDRTREMPPPARQGPADQTQEEQDRRLAMELSRRGVPPDEVQRLLALGRGETPAPSKPAAPVAVTPPLLPPSEPHVPKPTITLPEFREAAPPQRIEADRILTNVSIARRRGNYKEAERLCREALELVPKDAAALELYGDILQGVGRVDDALYAYQRATEADPARKSAEKKYAELMLLQNREIAMLRQEFIPRNPNVAVLFSAVCPGAGQFYNGDALKGLFTAVAFLVCLALLLWSPLGIPHHSKQGMPVSLMVLLGLAGLVYIFGVMDSLLSAQRGKRMKTGWEV